MALTFPYLPLNPLPPRPKGGKDAEGMKKQIPSNNTSTTFGSMQSREASCGFTTRVFPPLKP